MHSCFEFLQQGNQVLDDNKYSCWPFIMTEWVQANWVDGQMLHYESATSYPLECFHVD